MATSKKILEQEPGDVEMLLPWHATGTLNAREARRVDNALARDPKLARQYAAIQEEYAQTLHFNENLGAPSARAMQKLFAAIDGEPARKPSVSLNSSVISVRLIWFLASLGALPLLLQAGVIGAVLVKNQTTSFQTASLGTNEPARESGPEAPPRTLVRFAADARIAEITALLDTYQASIVDGAKGGMFRLQFGNQAMTKDEIASLIGKLQTEKIVSLAVLTP